MHHPISRRTAFPMKATVLLMVFSAACTAVSASAPEIQAGGHPDNRAGSIATEPAAIRDSANPDDFLLRKRIEMPRMANLLADVASRLPDDTTLERLSVDDRNKLELQGLAFDTVKIVDLLGKSDLLVDPTVRGVPQVDRRTKKERFDIVADLRTGIGSNARKNRPAFLVAADSDSAFREMTERLERAIHTQAERQQSCSIVTKSLYADDAKEPYSRVVVQVRMRCALDACADVVFDLEDGSSDLFVSRLMIFRQEGGYEPTDGEAQSTMNIRFNLSGYLRQRPSP